MLDDAALRDPEDVELGSEPFLAGRLDTVDRADVSAACGGAYGDFPVGGDHVCGFDPEAGEGVAKQAHCGSESGLPDCTAGRGAVVEEVRVNEPVDLLEVPGVEDLFDQAQHKLRFGFWHLPAP